MLIKYLLHLHQVLLRADKRMCYKVYIFLNRQQYVAAVFLCQRRQVNMLTRNINRLVRTQFTVVHNLHCQVLTVILQHLHVQLAVIKKYVITNLHILADAWIRQSYAVMFSIVIRISDYSNPLPCMKLYRVVGTRGADLRSLCVNKYSQVRRHSTDIAYYLLQSLRRSVSGVHTYNIHTGLI